MLHKILKLNVWATYLDSKTRCTQPQSVLFSAYVSQVSRGYFPRSIKALVLIIQMSAFFGQ